jgi:hypothetical protein
MAEDIKKEIMGHDDRLGDLSPKVFRQLVSFLGTVAPEGASGDPIADEVFRLRRFIPGMTAIQQMELYDVIKSGTDEAFLAFRGRYADLEVDPTGRSKPLSAKAWQARLQMLDAAYSMAKASVESSGGKDVTKHAAHTQVIDAKELNSPALLACRFSRPAGYDEKLFVESGILPGIAHAEIRSHEDALRPIAPRIGDLIRSVEEICLRKKDRDGCALFADHVFSRLEILMQDRELSDPQNKAYADRINFIFPPKGE